MNSEQETEELGEELLEDESEYTPRIAILGAGPMGLETALYARYLGYEVAVLEKETVASNVLRWGHVRMFSPFGMNRSTLGVAAMQAHYEDISWPADHALLTGKEYAESYLLPLSQTDLISGCIHERVEVLSTARDGILKSDVQGVDRADFLFRILVRTQSGEDVVDADVVIDTTGVFDQPNYLGHGGLPAIGELGLCEMFCRHVPDVLGSERANFAGKRILVVGNGYSAATSVVALSELHRHSPLTQTTWITRREAGKGGPMPIVDSDALLERKQLSQRANRATKANDSGITHVDQTSVLAVSLNEKEEFDVTLGGKLQGSHTFDSIISGTGFRPNTLISRELQVDLCAATEAIKPMAEWFSEIGNVDGAELSLPGNQVMQVTEPNYFVIGSKSFGRNSNFLLSLGLQQIREAFTIIAEREDLDLYETMKNLI